jgi:hypothetical protein
MQRRSTTMLTSGHAASRPNPEEGADVQSGKGDLGQAHDLRVCERRKTEQRFALEPAFALSADRPTRGCASAHKRVDRAARCVPTARCRPGAAPPFARMVHGIAAPVYAYHRFDASRPMPFSYVSLAILPVVEATTMDELRIHARTVRRQSCAFSGKHFAAGAQHSVLKGPVRVLRRLCRRRSGLRRRQRKQKICQRVGATSPNRSCSPKTCMQQVDWITERQGD